MEQYQGAVSVEEKTCEGAIRVRSTFVSSEFEIVFQAAICAFDAVATRTVPSSDKGCYLVPRDSL